KSIEISVLRVGKALLAENLIWLIGRHIRHSKREQLFDNIPSYTTMPADVGIVQVNAYYSIDVRVFNGSVRIHVFEQSAHPFTMVCFLIITRPSTFLPNIICILDRNQRFTVNKSVQNMLRHSNTETGMSVFHKT